MNTTDEITIARLKEDNRMHSQTITHLCKENVYLHEALVAQKALNEDLRAVNDDLEKRLISCEQALQKAEMELV